MVATIRWCGVISCLRLKLFDVTIGLRVTADEETEGQDTALYGERGYNW